MQVLAKQSLHWPHRSKDFKSGIEWRSIKIKAKI
jgi:hypothetical protein